MLDAIASQIMSVIVASLTGTAIGAIGGYLLSRRKVEKAIRVGVQALLRKELVDAFREYVIEEKPMTVERKSELTSCNEAYVGLGGNGMVATQIWPHLEAIKPVVIDSMNEVKNG